MWSRTAQHIRQGAAQTLVHIRFPTFVRDLSFPPRVSILKWRVALYSLSQHRKVSLPVILSHAQGIYNERRWEAQFFKHYAPHFCPQLQAQTNACKLEVQLVNFKAAVLHYRTHCSRAKKVQRHSEKRRNWHFQNSKGRPLQFISKIYCRYLRAFSNANATTLSIQRVQRYSPVCRCFWRTDELRKKHTEPVFSALCLPQQKWPLCWWGAWNIWENYWWWVDFPSQLKRFRAKASWLLKEPNMGFYHIQCARPDLFGKLHTLPYLTESDEAETVTFDVQHFLLCTESKIENEERDMWIRLTAQERKLKNEAR